MKTPGAEILINDMAASSSQTYQKEENRVPYPPLRNLLVSSHHSCVTILEARVDGPAPDCVDYHPDKRLLERTPVPDKDVHDRERVVHKVTTRHEKVCDRVIGGAISLVLVDVDLVICVECHANVVRLHLVVECPVRVDGHVRGPKRVLVVHDEDEDASDDTHDILLELTSTLLVLFLPRMDRREDSRKEG